MVDGSSVPVVSAETCGDLCFGKDDIEDLTDGLAAGGSLESGGVNRDFPIVMFRGWSNANDRRESLLESE